MRVQSLPIVLRNCYTLEEHTGCERVTVDWRKFLDNKLKAYDASKCCKWKEEMEDEIKQIDEALKYV